MGTNGASSAEERASALVALGLDPKAAATAAQSSKTYDPVASALAAAGLGQPDHAPAPDSDEGRKAAALVYTATVKLSDKKTAKTKIPDSWREILYRAIGDGRIAGKVNLDAAVAWLSTKAEDTNDEGNANATLDEHAFEEAAGVGVVIQDSDIAAAVDRVLDEHSAEVKEKRYRFNSGLVLRKVMEELKFADGKIVRDTLTRRLEEILGPKTDADLAKPVKQKTKARKEEVVTGKQKSEVAARNSAGMTEEAEPEDPFAGIPSSFQARDLESMKNSAELLEKYKRATGGKIITRFPPEPNGYLHVGHAKAMFISFGYAHKMEGETILRFDDTNPVAEKTEYIDSIKDIVQWMGHAPVRVTYSSDYFEELFGLAVELIRRDKAYVCHQTGDEIKRDRETMTESPYRNRPKEESIALFYDMRKGKFGEGEATLRMKIDMKSPNSVMRDPIAYRVLHSPHPKTGDAWCVYPSYDYTHCIVDSLEWITHSLCTLEFEIRRDSYYWLLEALDLYRPFVWEFARLSLEYTMMSKRKLKELVERRIVSGWDDPRMPTLSGMRRRGYSPEALNKFCATVGASRASNMIGMHVLEHCVRSDLDQRCERAFAVLRPLRVVITNFRGEETLQADKHPKNKDMGQRELPLTQVVYIEASDFRLKDEPKYYGLAPGKTAMLRYAFPIKVTEVVSNADGTPSELRVEMDYEKTVKPKGVLHWLPENAPRAEIRLYANLFKSREPAALDKSAWLEDLNPASREVVEGAIVEPCVLAAPVRTSFQFERIGYFTVDDDRTPEKPVLNLVVSLRDSR